MASDSKFATRTKEKNHGDFPSTSSLNDEDARLHELGVRRELRKEFTAFSTLSFALGVLGCAASIASTVNTPLLLGGPATTVWSWLLGSVGCLAIAASVAELVSAYPTSGGIYTSTAFVVPKRYRSSVMFVSAWISLIGQLATPASVTFALAQFIFAAVTISTSGSFVATPAQLLGLYAALTCLLGILNCLPTKALHKITSVYVFFNILTTLAIIIAVPAAGAFTGGLADSNFVWTRIIDNTNYNSPPLAFLLGLFCVQWVMTDYDAAAHLSEEIKSASTTAPVAIFSAVAITAVLGFFTNLSLCYGIRDYGSLPGPTGLVVSQILWDTLTTRPALVLWSFIILVQTMTAATCQLACVRTVYVLSRDNALPFSGTFSRINTWTRTPVNAVIITVIIAILFGLLELASSIAVNAVFSITAVALDLSYMIPVVAKLYITSGFYHRSSSSTIYTESKEGNHNNDVRFTPGPFYMGRKWGTIVNIYAVMWTLLETGILLTPQLHPVTAQTMNYSAPIIVFVCGGSWIWYWAYWHRYYTPPNAEKKALVNSDDVDSEVRLVSREETRITTSDAADNKHNTV